MDIGIQQITNIIIASTTDYMVTFSPIFLLMGGLVLAFVIVFSLLGFFPNARKNDFSDNRDNDDDFVRWP